MQFRLMQKVSIFHASLYIPDACVSQNCVKHWVYTTEYWLASGCKLSPYERRNGVQWFSPTGDRFESASIYNGICKSRSWALRGLKNDYE